MYKVSQVSVCKDTSLTCFSGSLCPGIPSGVFWSDRSWLLILRTFRDCSFAASGQPLPSANTPEESPYAPLGLWPSPFPVLLFLRLGSLFAFSGTDGSTEYSSAFRRVARHTFFRLPDKERDPEGCWIPAPYWSEILRGTCSGTSVWPCSPSIEPCYCLRPLGVAAASLPSVWWDTACTANW